MEITTHTVHPSLQRSVCRPASAMTPQGGSLVTTDSVLLGSSQDQANVDMENLRRQASGRGEGNFFQRGLVKLGNSAGNGIQSLAGITGRQVNKTVRNPLRWLPGASAAMSTADVLGWNVPGDDLELPGTEMLGSTAESMVRGVGAFGGDTVRETAEAVAHPVQTTVGLSKLAEGLQTDTPIGMASTALESIRTGRNYLDVRAERRAPVEQAVAGMAKDFQANRQEIGLPGALVKTGLDVFGLPKAAALSGAKLSKIGKAAKVAEEAVDTRPTWLRVHRETPTELQSLASDVAPGMRQKAEGLLDSLGSGNSSVFHATTSDALQGLSESGQILSAKAMEARRMERVSGEGTTMFARAQRDWVSLGEGAEGFGSVLRYHDNLVEAPYSFGKLDGQALKAETARMEAIVKDPKVENSIPGSQDLAQARLNDLKAEAARRNPSGEARDLYPVIFGFRRDGMELSRSSDVPGEVRNSRPVDMVENLESVIAPQARQAEIQSFLERTLGPDHGVEFISSEAIHQAKGRNLTVHQNFARMGDGVGADTSRDLDVAYDLTRGN